MHRSLVALALAVATVAVAASPLHAGEVVVLTGSIDANDPTMPVVFITAPNCTGQGVSPVSIEVLPFTASVSGTYTFTQISQDAFASLYLMDGSFDASAPFPHCLAGDNGADPVGFTEVLGAGLLYYAVPFDDTFDQLGGTFELIVEGPGVMTFYRIFRDGFETGDASHWSTFQPLAGFASPRPVPGDATDL